MSGDLFSGGVPPKDDLDHLLAIDFEEGGAEFS
jgi:hypothetical protein